MAAETHVPILTRTDFDAGVVERLDQTDNPEVGDGWFCIQTRPFPCPADGCDFVAVHLTAAHRIVVWPDKDDSKLLRTAFQAKEVGRDPHVVEYKPSDGPCIPWDLWIHIGKPIHGRLDRPDGWPPAFRQ